MVVSIFVADLSASSLGSWVARRIFSANGGGPGTGGADSGEGVPSFIFSGLGLAVEGGSIDKILFLPGINSWSIHFRWCQFRKPTSLLAPKSTIACTPPDSRHRVPHPRQKA